MLHFKFAAVHVSLIMNGEWISSSRGNRFILTWPCPLRPACVCICYAQNSLSIHKKRANGKRLVFSKFPLCLNAWLSGQRRRRRRRTTYLHLGPPFCPLIVWYSWYSPELVNISRKFNWANTRDPFPSHFFHDSKCFCRWRIRLIATPAPPTAPPFRPPAAEPVLRSVRALPRQIATIRVRGTFRLPWRPSKQDNSPWIR